MLKLNINEILHFDSIKKKLIFFMTAISIISVLIGVISSTMYSIGDMRESIKSKMETTTEIVGSMSEGALLFGDSVTANDTLQVLQKEREIVMACLYKGDNMLLGQYSSPTAGVAGLPRECPAILQDAALSGGKDVYAFVRPVMDSSGEQAGTILVVAHMVTLQDLIAKQIWITVIIVLLVSILALGVSYVIQPIITGPILSLVNLTRRISEEKDYSLRASINSDDEVGALSASFNDMLTTIQEREKELYEINEKAEMASRSKSEFLANMSHEIRTPINGILGFAQLLSVMPLEEKQRSFVDIILSSGNALLTVINDILDFSKIEAGKLHIESVPFDLGRVVENVIDIMTARAEEKKLELAMRYAPGTPNYVIGDPGRVKQVLINYVSNAIKFTAQGHVMVNVEARILGNTETIIRFEVIDTGIGISKEAQRKIFEKFMQADASTTKRYGGTGLGLAISQQLAHLMGGEVGVLSEEGKGSNFWFEVPFRIDQNQEQKRTLPEVDISGCHLLIVDDHEVNRRILLELSESWKVRAQAAESGEEALQMMKKAKQAGEPFHIAILDYQLPNMDGEDLSNLIKTDRDLADTSLILLTSMGMRGDANKFQEIGFDAYLVKPARASVLLDTVTTVWLNRQKGAKPEEIITQHTFAGEAKRREHEAASELMNRQYRDNVEVIQPAAPTTTPTAAPAAAAHGAPAEGANALPPPMAGHPIPATAGTSPEGQHPASVPHQAAHARQSTQATQSTQAAQAAQAAQANQGAPAVPAAETQYHADVSPTSAPMADNASPQVPVPQHVPHAPAANTPPQPASPSMPPPPAATAQHPQPVAAQPAASHSSAAVPSAVAQPLPYGQPPAAPQPAPIQGYSITPATTPSRPVASPSQPATATASAPRILLVEDQLTNRLVVENILENIGLRTIHAENGQEAVDVVRRQSFDLVLMDVQMPIMNGYDATREIRKIEQTENRPRMPIIAITANAMQGDREKCLEAGMDHYLSKPIQVPELQELIQQYLGVTSN